MLTYKGVGASNGINVHEKSLNCSTGREAPASHPGLEPLLVFPSLLGEGHLSYGPGGPLSAGICHGPPGSYGTPGLLDSPPGKQGQQKNMLDLDSTFPPS